MAKKKKKIDSYKERIIVLQRYASGETPQEIAENGGYELDDVIAAVGETGGGDQSDVSTANHANPHREPRGG